MVRPEASVTSFVTPPKAPMSFSSRLPSSSQTKVPDSLSSGYSGSHHRPGASNASTVLPQCLPCPLPRGSPLGCRGTGPSATEISWPLLAGECVMPPRRDLTMSLQPFSWLWLVLAEHILDEPFSAIHIRVHSVRCFASSNE